MKKMVIMIAMLAGSSLTFTSCMKDYTCTCTTTVGDASTTMTYDLPNQKQKDAETYCDRFEYDANMNMAGTTTCDL